MTLSQAGRSQLQKIPHYQLQEVELLRWLPSKLSSFWHVRRNVIVFCEA
jgi:hypothetical protein